MGMGIVNCKEALNYSLRGFFKDIHSVMDMGDMDLSVPYDVLEPLVTQAGFKLDSRFDECKNFPGRPRVPLSAFWNLLGIKSADRMDIVASERPDPRDQEAVYIKNLNEPLDDKSMWGKYDLVTDFGNNEHPFNIVEAYRTMHRLTKPSGYMWIIQEVYGGNGFYNLDKPFFENLAAVNQYEIFNAAYRLDKAFNVQYDIPCDKDLLSLIDFGKVDKVGITYIFRRTNSKDFKLPYQGYGATVPGNSRDTYYQSNISVHDQSFLWRNFIPHSIDSLSGPLMLRILIQRFKKKLPLIGKFFK